MKFSLVTGEEVGLVALDSHPLLIDRGCCFFFQAEDGIRDLIVTGVQTCALPISDDANALMRAIGLRPSCWAFAALITRTAAPPSLMPEALAAVTVPSLANAGLSEIGRASCRERV